jgi:hypothetical protein
MGTWDGTDAYSNGEDTGTAMSCAGSGSFGEDYQCVELVMRYFQTHFNLWWDGNANQLLANAPASTVDVFYNGDTHMPVPGDLIVWNDDKYGHTALITAVSVTSITILEQNVRGAGAWATLPISEGKVHGPAGWGWVDPEGWAHATVNGGWPLCMKGAGVGDRCGDETIISRGDPSTLYHCDGPGPAVLVEKCGSECLIGASGGDSVCK